MCLRKLPFYNLELKEFFNETSTLARRLSSTLPLAPLPIVILRRNGTRSTFSENHFPFERFMTFLNSTFIWCTPPADQESEGSLHDVDSETRCPETSRQQDLAWCSVN